MGANENKKAQGGWGGRLREYLRKGKSVYIEGKLRTDKYTDKDGIERYSTDIVGDELQLLGGAPNASDDESAHPAGPPRPSSAQRPAAGQGARPAPAARAAAPPQDFDDEIPF